MALRQPGWRRLPLRALAVLATGLVFGRPVRSRSGLIVGPDCPPLGHPAFARWLDGMRQLASGRPLPVTAHVAVTGACPNACARCSQVVTGCGEPAISDVLRVIEGLRQAGTASLTFTGGEPLMRGDLEQAIAACGSDMAPQLYTSGYGLDDRRARSLQQAGLVAAHVSLDHDQRERHDQGRGRRGSACDAAFAITALRRAGIHTVVRTVVGDELLQPGAMRRFVMHCRDLGAHEIVLLAAVSVRGGAPESVFSERASRILRRWHMASWWDATLPVITAMPYLEGPEGFGCIAGFGFCYVAVDGGVWPCDLAPCALGNIHRDRWDVVLERLRQAFPRPRTACLGCQLARIDSAMPRPLIEDAAVAALAACPADQPARMARAFMTVRTS
jgi:MoaA/NifB/PqqE/SkfB family radical SAM enzyme